MEILILFLVCMLSVLILFLFKRSNHILKKKHIQRERGLQKQLEKNNKQIQKRHHYLTVYKLLEYNLEESLCVQEEIDLYLK